MKHVKNVKHVKHVKHVKAVIFDWAGTVVDYGSLAPMGAFVETFEQFGVDAGGV
ncbi:Phosphonoacetaldehyde hydrolase [Paraburkholderia ultramafica]|uniref:Phosphonoacetaldehyde hydrolase n=1 Tax=Paraburkholderia ultramafica TaxID=1544867 RepID=A0A6S7B7H4_9BURK|nr:hypothetical protein [Paraburkholderia ultramafica]CAB3780006.1 Phosphonoacetaldehyde hydrolase [Paraburkholderia ultramafica]